MRNFWDLSNCASMAKYEVNGVKFDLEYLKRDIQEKSTEQTESAIFELGRLCTEYTTLLTRYEHLASMTEAHKQDTIKEETEKKLTHELMRVQTVKVKN